MKHLLQVVKQSEPRRHFSHMSETKLNNYFITALNHYSKLSFISVHGWLTSCKIIITLSNCFSVRESHKCSNTHMLMYSCGVIDQ